MPGAPYDEQNATDFREMTEKIDRALKTIEESLTIPATEKELARLAECSRGTLRYRVYPLQRLKNIKLERKRKRESADNSKKSTVEVKTAEEILREENATLRQQLHNSRSEVAVWVQKYQELKDEKSRVTRAKQVLEAERQALREENKQLKQKLKKFEETQGVKPTNDVVIPFPKSSRVERGHGSLAKSAKKKTLKGRRG
jgi:hypothetical protein